MEFLPGYDKLQYSKNYDEELEKVNNLKNKLFPKKKFVFLVYIRLLPQRLIPLLLIEAEYLKNHWMPFLEVWILCLGRLV